MVALIPVTAASSTLRRRTARSTRHGGSVPVLFGKFRILGKLALLVLVPLLGVVTLSVPIVVNRINAATDARDTSDVVKLAGRVGSAVHELQEERLLSIGYYFQLVPQSNLVLESAEAQDALDGLNHLDKPLSDNLRRAVAQAAKLDNARQSILNRTITPDVIMSQFANVITPILNALNLPGHADLSTTPGRQVFALDQALRSDDQISQASAWLTGAVAVGTFATNDAQRKAAAGLVNAFYSVLIQLQATIINGQRYFTPTQYRLYLAAQEAFASRVGPTFLVQAVVDPNAAVKTLKLGTLFPSLQSVNVLGG